MYDEPVLERRPETDFVCEECGAAIGVECSEPPPFTAVFGQHAARYDASRQDLIDRGRAAGLKQVEVARRVYTNTGL